MKPSNNNIAFEFFNPENKTHCKHLVDLINHYMADPMGDSPLLTQKQEEDLITGIQKQSNTFVLFVTYNTKIAGLVTCFVNFSTFKAKPYINIHDIIVYAEYRKMGLGKALMEKVISIAQEHRYCKVTLEVRDDNTNAMELYKNLGFKDTVPVMHFWTKTL